MRSKTKKAPGRRWHQWTEVNARAALAEFETRGGSLVDFARSKGVSTRRLAYWRTRLAPTTPPAFVAVAGVGEALSPRPPVEILVGGVVLRAPDAVDAERIAALVHALAQRLGC